MSTDKQKLWGGRFSGQAQEDMTRFSQCMDVDMRMWRYDIQGSKAHAQMLADVGILGADELAAMLSGLEQVAQELDSGAFVPTAEHEDIHMAVEARLTEIIGVVGAKLHTARSRNDQVATDVRLWLRARLAELKATLCGLVEALLIRIEADGAVLMPGFTHLQRGQPILMGHHLLAYAFMVQRDVQRVTDHLARFDACPLGACAMAGTPHPIDRAKTASLLGFAGPVENAMDAVSARDHLCEAASLCAIAMSHLSRMAEELVLWSTQEFALVSVAEGYATGSSIMPQKRNPDAAELVRGKCGQVFGDLQALLTMVKGLPLAYNRDLQEDRQAAFRALDSTVDCAQIMAGMWATLQVHSERYEQVLTGDFLLATELADYLVQKNVAFRDAHHVVGRIVAHCEAQGTNFSALTTADLQAFHSSFEADVLSWLEPRAAAERRTSHGGTASSEIARQVSVLRAWLAQQA